MGKVRTIFTRLSFTVPRSALKPSRLTVALAAYDAHAKFITSLTMSPAELAELQRRAKQLGTDLDKGVTDEDA